MAKRLNLVVTVNQNDSGDDTFGDIIGVFEEFSEAISVRDWINDKKKLPGLDLSLLCEYTSVEVITRDLNTYFKNSDT